MDKFNILLVDDIDDNLYSLRAIIENHFEINIFSSLNVKDAISVLLENKIDLILSDIQMPGIDGFQFAEYIKGIKNLKDIPIIFITGIYNKVEYEKKAYNLGAIEYILKPIDDDLLVDKLKNFINIFENKRKTEEEISEKNELLIHQAKMATIGEMVGVISHQMKQPLNILSLYCSDVKNSYDFNELDEEFIKEFTKSTQDQIKFLNTTIDGFIDFFNPNKEKHKFKIRDAFDEVAELLNKQIEYNNITLNIEINDEMTFGVKNELKQVFLNLITNSKDAFIDRNMNKRNISIKTSLIDNHLILLEIEDNAGGIKNELLDKIFNPYFTTKEYGTGTGLYMVNLVIRNSFQGNVKVVNTQEGVKFNIELPLIL